MKIFIPNISSTKIGGGWTFLKNFTTALSRHTDIEIVDLLESCDIVFAFAPTIIDDATIAKAKMLGKKFVLRIDGVPEDNRNRGGGTRRLLEYARAADLVIYQTAFVENTVGRILDMNGVGRTTIVKNGVDTSVFTPDGAKLPPNGFKNILHINYRKDNNKRVEEVIQMYRELWTYRQDVNLVLMGRYPTEWLEHNMGFFNGERVNRLAPTESREALATVMRSCDLFFYPSFADPSPNVVMEAMACGLPTLCQGYGGSSEILDSGMDFSIDPFLPLGYQVSLLIDEAEKLKNESESGVDLVRGSYSLEEMAKNYKMVFERL